jgi:hypothetical protein
MGAVPTPAHAGGWPNPGLAALIDPQAEPIDGTPRGLARWRAEAMSVLWIVVKAVAMAAGDTHSRAHNAMRIKIVEGLRRA